MFFWIDTEAKWRLCKTPPYKIAPPKTIAFTLVVLSLPNSADHRVVRAAERVLGTSFDDAHRCLQRDVPIVVKSGLVHTDALAGQFEFICCDAVAVFICDHVVAAGDQDYLNDLYARLRQSPEFAQTEVLLDYLPLNDLGRMFSDQFLGLGTVSYPVRFIVPYKKARAMCHWATKIGGIARFVWD